MDQVTLTFAVVMDDSFTLTLWGTSSILETQYFPPIELSPNKNYALGLVEFLTFNSIPNVDIGQNRFYVGNKVITIPTGSYETGDIQRYLQYVLVNEGIDIHIKPNNNTLKSEIYCNREINFDPKDSIGRLLGFTQKKLEANKLYESDQPVSIIKVNSLRVECSITTGAYINGQKVHTIHEFYPIVPPGYKIVEVPSHINYLPVAVQTINHIQLRIVDQDGHLVNFRGEVITVRLHVKSLR